MGVTARRIACGVGILLACACADAVHAEPVVRVTADGVVWSGAMLDGVPRQRDALAAWREAARDTGLVGLAVRTALADSLAARGDTLAADSILAVPRLAGSLWGWDALARRASYRLAHGDTAGALRLLEARDETGWSASEQAAWRARLAPLRVALRDTLGGEALAREVLDRMAGQAPASLEALTLLTMLASVRGTSFPVPLARRAAEAEWANGRRVEALARLQRVARLAPADERVVDELQRVRWWREWRRPRTALAACDTALRYAREPRDRDAVRLERARAQRDAGQVDSSLAAYRRLARTSQDPRVRMTAWWEAAREAQDRSRWREAAVAFVAADSLGHEVREGRDLVRDAGTLAGLMDWLAGRRDEAIQQWRPRRDRRARFWLGVALRQRGLAEGDSILRVEFAERPGFDLLQAAARDTLGLPGWPRTPALTPAADSLEPQLGEALARLAGPLALPEAAARLVTARDRADIRLPRGPQRMFASSSWRAVAFAAYTAGDLAAATRAADRALLAPLPDSIAWGWSPWAFPPAFAREVARAAESNRIEPALLWALTRQESRFDPRAVSRSRALGLAQLLPGTAGDMARELRESLPVDTLMFEPDRALRYGARYLRKLLDRFDGEVPVALTAYNAGPGKVRPDWRELIERGGWMLYTEMAANADTQDYVRRILGYRQAYREYRPTIAP